MERREKDWDGSKADIYTHRSKNLRDSESLTTACLHLDCYSGSQVTTDNRSDRVLCIHDACLVHLMIFLGSC